MVRKMINKKVRPQLFVHFEKERNYIGLRIDFDNFMVALKSGNKGQADYRYKKLTNDILLLGKGYNISLDKKIGKK